MTGTGVTIRLASTDDAPAIAAIYAPVVADTAISFEEVPPTADRRGWEQGRREDRRPPHVIAAVAPVEDVGAPPKVRRQSRRPPGAPVEPALRQRVAEQHHRRPRQQVGERLRRAHHGFSIR